MYQTHFHLNDRPFASAPNPEHYFPAASIEQAREAIALSIERAAGVTLLMGPVGSGKTLLCQLLANQFSNELPVCMLPGERLRDRTLLLQAILHRLDLPYRDQNEGELRLTLSNHVTGASCPNGILLIVDEADRLPLELLEEIRVITNLVRDGHPCVRLVLAGGPRLEERVGHPRLESLNQRVVGRWHLENFAKEETADYVSARIAASGGDVNGLFTADAIDVVYQATAGVPRLINQVCDHALLMSSVDAVDQLTAGVMEEAWADLQQLPVPKRTQGAPNMDSVDEVVEFGSLDDDEANVTVCAQLDELHQVVADVNRDLDVASVEVTGDVEFEVEETVSVAIDGDFEMEQEVEITGAEEHTSSSEETAELVVSDPMTTETSSFPDHGSIEVRFEDDDVEEEANSPDILPSPFVQQEQVLASEQAEDEPSEDAPVLPTFEERELTLAEANNPFREQFEDEEVVIQQFASPSVLARQGQAFVGSSYSVHLANRLSAAHPGLRMLDAEEPHEQRAERDAGYQPLSACLSPDDELPEPAVAHDADGFDPSLDPVLPESEITGPELPIDQEPLLVDHLYPAQDLSASDSDVTVIMDSSLQLGVAASSEQTIIVDEPGIVSEKPAPKKKIFRRLFSSMRRS